MAHNLYIGLMSGTSTDAIDAALVSVATGQVNLLASYKLPLPDRLRQEILALNAPTENEIQRMMTLDVELGRQFAKAATEVLALSGHNKSEIKAIGSHGQTVRHRPDGEAPNTLQIGDPNIIAELSGITTIGDFRRRDMAAGGQGAPLAPAFHSAMFRSTELDRVIVNIGGIANTTILPKDTNQPVIGFDTGPGNVLMDAWINKHRQKNFDQDGLWAAQGEIDQVLVTALLSDSYFKLMPPKSTGRDDFHLPWLEQYLKDLSGITPENIQASLCELTAKSIADAIANTAPATKEVYVCGGGSHNPLLMKRLQHHLPKSIVASTEALGIHPDWVEAMAFAWLAHQTLSGMPGNLPAVTGANHPVILGGVYHR
ncbi:MAG: anhydro-N-acetylmuramic acid kinase [Gammaproteobacteria bacterium]|nr:anhydro-N-acetylmuramic acid kinase [Gammaproteobacteria bacterium]